MKGKRHTPEQIIEILRQAETTALPVAEFCRQQGISKATFNRWRKRFRGVDLAQVRQWRELSAENARLKKLLAERNLEIDALRQFLGTKS